MEFTEIGIRIAKVLSLADDWAQLFPRAYQSLLPPDVNVTLGTSANSTTFSQNDFHVAMTRYESKEFSTYPMTFALW